MVEGLAGQDLELADLLEALAGNQLRIGSRV